MHRTPLLRSVGLVLGVVASILLAAPGADAERRGRHPVEHPRFGDHPGAPNHHPGKPGAEPRIVLPAFVVRCSTLPDEPPFRVARPTYCVNEEGEGIGDPGADPRIPVLEPVPELQWEAFDEYWRKVHGPKIIHQEGPGDVATPLLLRYEQQHRIPGGPTSEFPPPYEPQVGEDGLLVTDPHRRVRPYQAPAFDGLAQLAFADLDDFFAFFGIEPGDKYLEKIVPDERVFLKGFAFNVSKEYILLPDREPRDPIILIKTHERAPHLSREEFQELWLEEHGKDLVTDPRVRHFVGRYAQLHNISTPDHGAFYDPVGDRFDVISVLSFPNVTYLERFLVSEAYDEIEAFEAEHTAETRYFTAVNYVIRLLDPVERSTKPRFGRRR
jgi:hypothetical protein